MVKLRCTLKVLPRCCVFHTDGYNPIYYNQVVYYLCSVFKFCRYNLNFFDELPVKLAVLNY